MYDPYNPNEELTPKTVDDLTAMERRRSLMEGEVTWEQWERMKAEEEASP